jgi:hypothetical protein
MGLLQHIVQEELQGTRYVTAYTIYKYLCEDVHPIQHAAMYFIQLCGGV